MSKLSIILSTSFQTFFLGETKKKHEILCRDALEKTKLPVIGVIPKNPILNLESRHLGLISTYDNKILKNKLEKVH